MKKIKKFNLNQSRFLSSEEMAKLYGGEYLHSVCNYSNLGQSCVVSINGFTYSGKCKFESNYSTDGMSSSLSKTYFCYAEF